MIKLICRITTLALLYLILSQLIDTALTSFRWQVKAVTIYNLLGGTIEPWWSESPITIAIDLSFQDAWWVIKLIGGMITWGAGRLVNNENNNTDSD